MSNGSDPPIDWQRLARDLGIAILLVLVTFNCFDQAARHDPAFQASDLHVIEAPIAGFTTADSPEHAAAPQRNTGVIRSRSALLLAGWPENFIAYIPGSSWQMEHDLAPGAVVRIEVTADPQAQAARARQFPDTIIQQPIVGLQIGERVYFRASDTIAAAEQAALRYRRFGALALLLTLLWLAWVVWSRRHDLHRLIAELRGLASSF